MARGDASETLVPHLRHRFLHEPKGVVCGNGNADCRGVLSSERTAMTKEGEDSNERREAVAGGE